MNSIASAVIALSGLGLIFGAVLAWVSKKFHVFVDPRITKVTELLPGINCGACGLAGCAGLAEAVVNKETELAVCVACSPENKKEIAAVLGVSAGDMARSNTLAAIIGCGGGTRCKNKFEYQGLKDCRVAALTIGAHKECRYSCLEQGTCIEACPFGAITMQPEGVPKVILERCVGCKKCVSVCPRRIIYMVERKKKDVYINCQSRDKGAQVMKKCKVGCIACGKCVKACPVNAIAIENNLAQIDYKKCINCKKCVAVCPTKAIALR
ncbi:MAG: RnfABCDGE type electron transport complex subunit B [Candidatus Omnitrophica bacterium]|nr:RnfABCDGE type electron transport complex subunit B [Candidatus Omnitrophota bacterium]MBU4477923.1 RnfABCDGE type electron transport complex subunit B [Candidatus Omnitrophota bacterium]MCG2703849.1 RnfABCDGE type electron transport complex subunit B [Candidatus Omnitrophota bacterium]